jgi:hypothetical protein
MTQEIKLVKCPFKPGAKCDKTDSQSCWERRCPILLKGLEKRG